MTRLLSAWYIYIICAFFPGPVQAGQIWPVSIPGPGGTMIKIYQPQPDFIRGNKITFRSAFSLTGKDEPTPEYGSFRAIAVIETNRINRTLSLLDVKISALLLPGKNDPAALSSLRQKLELALPEACTDILMDEWISPLCLHPEQYKLYVYGELNYASPKIIVAEKPSVLILIDGAPHFKWYKGWSVNVIANTPYMIIASDDGWYYLYGSRYWYIAPGPLGPYMQIGTAPPYVGKVQAAIAKDSRQNWQTASTEATHGAPDIIISTSPAELVQTKGPPLFTPVSGTSLYYVSNSVNDIFLDKALHRYFVLLSGRWFSADSLSGGWTYIAADSLPADFARIPESSPKGNVLSSVAGTTEALEAIVDGLIPQTARIERETATDTVVYDGSPRF